MKLTIIAATGGVGRQLLAQALDAGHDVTAVARNPAKLPAQLLAGRAARIVTADLAAPPCAPVAGGSGSPAGGGRPRSRMRSASPVGTG